MSKTTTDMAKEVLRGVRRADDCSLETLNVLLQLCLDQDDTTRFLEFLPAYWDKEAEFKAYHRKKGKEYRASHVEYTQRQMDIINGVIPYEKVHGKEYHGIRSIAHKRGDVKIEEMANALILEKQNDHAEQNKRLARQRYQQGRDDPSSRHYRPARLSAWEEDVLLGLIDISECSPGHMRQILDTCRRLGNEQYIQLAEFWMRYMEDPACLCRAKTREEALRSIAEMTWWPMGLLDGKDVN